MVVGQREIDEVWVRTYHETGRLIVSHILVYPGAVAGLVEPGGSGVSDPGYNPAEIFLKNALLEAGLFHSSGRRSCPRLLALDTQLVPRLAIRGGVCTFRGFIGHESPLPHSPGS